MALSIYRNGLRWRDATEEYGPHETLDNRWKRWIGRGVFAHMRAIRLRCTAREDRDDPSRDIVIALACRAKEPTYLKVHRTVSSFEGQKGTVEA